MSATTINIEGTEYTIADLPTQVQNLIGIHARWSQETEEARLTWAKNDAALRDLSREIVAAVKDEKPTAPAADAPTPGRKKKEKAAA